MPNLASFFTIIDHDEKWTILILRHEYSNKMYPFLRKFSKLTYSYRNIEKVLRGTN